MNTVIVAAFKTSGALNRVLTQTSSGANFTATYDTLNSSTYGVGRLRRMSDTSGSTTFYYDPLGHTIEDQRLINANTYATTYTYDPAGHVLTATYPSGRIVTYTRDAEGRISGITTQQSSGSSAVTILSVATYEPFGPLTGFSFGNGVVLAQDYDEDYELTSIDAATGTATIQNLTFGYDASGNILSDADAVNSGRSQSFTYDDLNRLWTASGLYGAQSYTYDGVGNRLTASLAGTSYTYTPSTTSNQIASIASGGNTRTFTYYASGQVHGDRRSSSERYMFDYDGPGVLKQASLNSSVIATYLHNGFGQRVVKTVGSTVTDLIYDRYGHLLAEANDATGAMIREYIWMDDKPVAMVDDTGTSPVVYFIHTDQVNKPQKLTDSSASIAWDGVFDPFGNVTSVTGSATMLLMFPGQYYDSETQLSQNWHRDYDPTMGRYVESDPLGLLVDFNTYSYTYNQPVQLADPTGQGVVGGIIGGGLGGLIGGGGGTVIEPGGGTAAGGYAGFEEGYALGSGIEDTINLMSTSSSNPTQQQQDYQNYKNICDEPPPPGLCGKALLEWKLNKAKACQKARQDYADTYFGGNMDPGHQTYMDQLNAQISNLMKALGL